jgi:signal transduction histidine kinase
MESAVSEIEHPVPPAAEKKPAGAGSDRTGSHIHHDPVNILLVDDDFRNLDVLESILKPSGHRLVRAGTADAALMALIQDDFACVVLDIQMPGMNGIELARLIKTRKRSRHIPIIFLTAYFQEEKDVLEGYGAGAVDYLTKPLNAKIFKSKVDVFVELFRTTRALAAANAALEERTVELAEANKQLRDHIHERQHLEALVLNISEREQQRIGQDLHDGLCQQLTGIKFKNRLLGQKLADGGFSEIQDTREIEKLLAQAIEQARNQALGLNPVRLEAEGLVTALSELAANITGVFGVECVCSFPDSMPVPDPAVAIHFYRIAQEAVTNAIKHGKAKKIQLRLAEREGDFQLMIQDNGTGLPAPPHEHNGMGMHIMNYRARTLGARLTVQAGEGGGTVVTCTLPRGGRLAPKNG